MLGACRDLAGRAPGIIADMHLLIPFASALSPACAQTLETLELPNLRRLLEQLGDVEVDAGDEYSLSPPHERALGAALGLKAADGGLPWAALQARDDGVDVGVLSWGLITPVHWQVGREQITLADPEALRLDEPASRDCFAAVRELFDSEGLSLTWGAPLRWYATHPSFADLPTASIDRVVGRNVDLWLQADPRARLIRRLQNEVQMLLYVHPLNDAREAAGALTVNSFWLSGCGALPAAVLPRPTVDESLRAPALQEDWAAWASAWHTLDAGPVRAMLDLCRRGEAAALTLCGERSAQTYRSAPRSLWQRIAARFRPVDVRAILAAL